MTTKINPHKHVPIADFATRDPKVNAARGMVLKAAAFAYGLPSGEKALASAVHAYHVAVEDFVERHVEASNGLNTGDRATRLRASEAIDVRGAVTCGCGACGICRTGEATLNTALLRAAFVAAGFEIVPVETVRAHA
jgi:hypothetical protein